MFGAGSKKKTKRKSAAQQAAEKRIPVAPPLSWWKRDAFKTTIGLLVIAGACYAYWRWRHRRRDSGPLKLSSPRLIPSLLAEAEGKLRDVDEVKDVSAEEPMVDAQVMSEIRPKPVTSVVVMSNGRTYPLFLGFETYTTTAPPRDDSGDTGPRVDEPEIEPIPVYRDTWRGRGLKTRAVMMTVSRKTRGVEVVVTGAVLDVAKFICPLIVEKLKDLSVTSGIPYSKEITGWVLGLLMGELFPSDPGPFIALNEKLDAIQKTVNEIKAGVAELIERSNQDKLVASYRVYNLDENNEWKGLVAFRTEYVKFLPSIRCDPNKVCTPVPSLVTADCSGHPTDTARDACIRKQIIEWRNGVLNPAADTGIEKRFESMFDESKSLFFPRTNGQPGMIGAWKNLVENSVPQPKEYPSPQAASPVVSYRRMFVSGAGVDLEERVFLRKEDVDAIWTEWIPWFELLTESLTLLVEAYHIPDVPGGPVRLASAANATNLYAPKIMKVHKTMPFMPAYIDTFDYGIQKSANLVWALYMKPDGSGPNTGFDNGVSAAGWRLPTRHEVTFLVMQMGARAPVDVRIDTPWPEGRAPVYRLKACGGSEGADPNNICHRLVPAPPDELWRAQKENSYNRTKYFYPNTQNSSGQPIPYGYLETNDVTSLWYNYMAFHKLGISGDFASFRIAADPPLPSGLVDGMALMTRDPTCEDPNTKEKLAGRIYLLVGGTRRWIRKGELVPVSQRGREYILTGRQLLDIPEGRDIVATSEYSDAAKPNLFSVSDHDQYMKLYPGSPTDYCYRSDINWFVPSYNTTVPPNSKGLDGQNIVLVRDYVPSSDYKPPSLPKETDARYIKEGAIVACTGIEGIWKIENGRRRWIVSPQTMSTFRFPAPVTVDCGQLKAIAMGPPLYSRSVRSG